MKNHLNDSTSQLFLDREYFYREFRVCNFPKKKKTFQQKRTFVGSKDEFYSTCTVHWLVTRYRFQVKSVKQIKKP